MRGRFGPAGALLLIAACAGDGGAATSTARLQELCQETLELPAGACDCIAEKAGADLSAGGLAFLVASLEQDDAKTTELRGKLTLEELTKAGMFMVGAPAACAGEIAK